MKSLFWKWRMRSFSPTEISSVTGDLRFSLMPDITSFFTWTFARPFSLSSCLPQKNQFNGHLWKKEMKWVSFSCVFWKQHRSAALNPSRQNRNWSTVKKKMWWRLRDRYSHAAWCHDEDSLWDSTPGHWIYSLRLNRWTWSSNLPNSLE